MKNENENQYTTRWKKTGLLTGIDDVEHRNYIAECLQLMANRLLSAEMLNDKIKGLIDINVVDEVRGHVVLDYALPNSLPLVANVTRNEEVYNIKINPRSLVNQIYNMLNEETFKELELDAKNIDHKPTYELLKYYIIVSILKNNPRPEVSHISNEDEQNYEMAKRIFEQEAGRKVNINDTKDMNAVAMLEVGVRYTINYLKNTTKG